MRIPIETNRKFVFRLEDFIYIFLIVYIIPIVGFVNEFFKHTSQKNASTPVIIITCIILIGVTTSTLLIFFSYRKRLQYQYYLEDETIIKERDGKEVFRIPFKEIVSVRVNNKKGTQGSVVFFTEARSKNFAFYDSFFGFNNTPLAAFGFTRKKIDLVKNRKQLLTAIYLVNPNLHFID